MSDMPASLQANFCTSILVHIKRALQRHEHLIQIEAEPVSKAAAERQEAAPSRAEPTGRRTKQAAVKNSKRMTRAQVRNSTVMLPGTPIFIVVSRACVS